MKTFSVNEAKNHFAKLLDLAANGEVVVIARASRPLGKLVGYTSDDKPRKPGYWKGKVEIGKHFDTLPPRLSSAYRNKTG